MIWLLIVVYLGGDPVSVQRAEIGQAIYKDAEQEGNPVSQNIVLGCTPFKRRIM